jgi:hypothetical protein
VDVGAELVGRVDETDGEDGTDDTDGRDEPDVGAGWLFEQPATSTTAASTTNLRRRTTCPGCLIDQVHLVEGHGQVDPAHAGTGGSVECRRH